MISDTQNSTAEQKREGGFQSGQPQTTFEAKRPREKQEPDLSEYGTELKYRSTANVGAGKFAESLGWFSTGLGLAELLVPSQVGEMIGVSSVKKVYFVLR